MDGRMRIFLGANPDYLGGTTEHTTEEEFDGMRTNEPIYVGVSLGLDGVRYPCKDIYDSPGYSIHIATEDGTKRIELSSELSQ
jgi:hypothetical protein